MKILLFVLAAAAAAAPASAKLAAEFVAPAEFSVSSEDGAVALAWEPRGEVEAGEAVVYEVRRWPADAGRAAPGVAVYVGRDTATFVSGLLAESYVFKVRARTAAGEFGPWSEMGRRVDVVFHGRAKVIGLMLAGAVTLAVAAGSIFTGCIRTRAG